MLETTGERAVDHDRMKALLTGNKDEWDSFDALFESYWIGAGKSRDKFEKTKQSTRTSKTLPRAWKDHFGEKTEAGKASQIESESDAGSGERASGRLIAVDRNTRFKTDMRQFVEPGEIAAAEALAYRLASAIRYRLSRRYYNSKKTTRLDLRRTIRSNIKYGGTPIDLRFKARPEQPVRIIVFLDISGSMQHYSRFFLQFVKGLVCQWTQSDAYLFHTRLVRITDVMRDSNSLRAMTRLSLMADGFGGGTKLGDCLETFNRQYAKKALNSRSIVMIFSDGYEVGTPEHLCEQLAKIKKRARRLVWLNPLLGWKNYQPVTAAMKMAQPLIDHFAVANTLESLAAIEPDLMKL
ncbi:MAG: VWA domain-containing protein [Rhizobiaceae bacterium]|nr:VWA domain-containing protein [Rhizobiaceae bacterium]